MNYRYNCGDEVIRVGVWNDDFHTTVIVTDNKTTMEVISKSIDLMQCTYRITSKRDRYPAKYKVLVERIQNECMNIYCYLMDANRLQNKFDKL